MHPIHQPVRSRLLGVIAIGLVALLVSAGAGHAQVSQWWTNTASSTFTDANSWSNAVPAGDERAYFAADGATYGVTFTGNTTNFALAVTNTGQNVTFDLAGYEYRITNCVQGAIGYGNDWLQIASGNTLTVSNGTLRGTPTNVDIENPAGALLIVTNGGRVFSSGMNGGGGLLISGPGSYYFSYDKFGNSGAITVNNSAVVGSMRGGTTADFYIDNAIVTNTSTLAGSGGSIVITNGGYLTEYFPVGSIYNSSAALGYNSTALATMRIGDNGDLGVTNLFEKDSLQVGRFDGWRNAHITINSNGVLRIRNSGTNSNYIARYGSFANYGHTRLWVSDGSDVTLVGGRIEMREDAKMDLANFPAVPDSTAAPGLLRGTGTLTILGGGTTNWTLTNDGWIKPGDTAAGAALGTINIAKGDLIQTGVLASMFFEFSDTGLDQIAIQDGTALITGGSNTFALASGSSAPSPGAKWGLGTYDFLTATNITWTPAYDSISNLLAGYGLTQNLDYRFGVVDLGSYQALRLEFVPEPSTILLLLGGGLVLWRLRRGK